MSFSSGQIRQRSKSTPRPSRRQKTRPSAIACTCLVTPATSFEKPVTEGVFDELRAPVEIELGHDPRAVGIDGLRADEQPLSDLEVREAARREAQHLALAWRERRLGAAVLVLLRREKEPNSSG